MARLSHRTICLLAIALPFAAPVAAQTRRPAGIAPTSAVPAAAATVLSQMASHAPVIFAGEVLSISRSDTAGFVDIRFRIDNAVRGCPQSGSYVLREWAGLWASQPERYRVGQRLLMLLSARSASGLSSPVGGTDGAIPIIATAAQPIADAAGTSPPDTTPTPLAIDLRWLHARAIRATTLVTTAHSIRPIADPALPDPGPAQVWPGSIAPLPSSNPSIAPPTSLAAVLALLANLAANRIGEPASARF